MEGLKRGNGVMKKLLRLLPLLLLSGAITHAMDNLGASIPRRDPFMQFPPPNAPKLSEEQILLLIKNGKYDDLAYELANGLKVDYKFTTGQYVGKNLLQLALEHSITNRHEIATMLLKHGAQTQDLNQFLTTAIKKIDPTEVKWLLEHGAKPAHDTSAVVAVLEKATEKPGQEERKEKLIKIKKLLEERQPQVSTKPVAVESRPKIEQTKARTELPVIKKFDKKDLFTVLGETEEKKLFNALLSGNEQKLAEYLNMGLSPDFIFTQGAPGKSLLKVAVTESIKNQETLADLLLESGADPKELNAGLILAIDRFEKPKVIWLRAKGAHVTDEVLAHIKDLEKNTMQPARQKIVAEIKKLLLEKRNLEQPQINRPSSSEPVAPITQFNKPLPPVPVKKPAAVILKSESIEPIKNIYGNKK